jgi:tetratricopeptide (TPR) repeat protein
MAEVALKYAQIGQKDKAERILAKVSQNAQNSPMPDDSTLLAVKYGEMGQQSKAEQLLAQALQKTKKTMGSQDHFFTDIAIGYAKIGQFNQAINTAKSIEGYADAEEYKNSSITPDGLIGGSFSPDAFVEIAKKCVEAERFDLALQAIKEIKFAGNNSEALTHLAVGYAALDRFDLALLTIDNMKETANSREALAQLAIYYGTVGQYERAFQLLKEIDFEYTKIEALIKIVEQATQVQSSTRAEQLLVPALKMVKTTRLERVNKAASLTAIAVEYAELGQKDKTEQLLAQALQIAENISY